MTKRCSSLSRARVVNDANKVGALPYQERIGAVHKILSPQPSNQQRVYRSVLKKFQVFSIGQ